MRLLLMCLALACGSLVVGRPQQGQQPIAIISLNSEVNPDGTFQYNYETANGISAEARGQLAQGPPGEEGQSIQGSFSFTADTGEQFTISYVADENGFQPQGAHLPTPPPIPEAILRALEYNERNPEPGEQSSNQVGNFVQSPQPFRQQGRRPFANRF